MNNNNNIGTVVCNTCKKSTTIKATNTLSLIQALDSGILSYHVTSPCSMNHILETQINLPTMKKHTLEIECIRCRSDPRHQHRSKLTIDTPLMLVNSVAICFHAAHEGHRFHLKYTDINTGEVIFEVLSPVQGRKK